MTEHSLTDVITMGDPSDLTDEHIRQFKDNPELIKLIGDRETLSLRNLWRILAIAALLVALSKVFSARLDDEYIQWVLEVFNDLVFEMGAALIGSVATVIFIQYQEKRQFEENIKFRAEVLRRVALLDKS